MESRLVSEEIWPSSASYFEAVILHRLGGMSAQSLQDLVLIFGAWSVLAALVSVASWFLGNTSPGARLLQRWHIDRLEFVRRLP